MSSRFKRTPRSPWAHWYTQKAWLDARARQLALHPTCQGCSSVGVVKVAEEVDHIVPHRGDRSLFFSGINLQSLCKSCHSRKTAREVAGHHSSISRVSGRRVVCLDAGKGSALASEGVAYARSQGWVVVDLRGVSGRARVERWNLSDAFTPGTGPVLLLTSIGGWQDRGEWSDAVGDAVDRVLVCGDRWCDRRTEGRHTRRYFTVQEAMEDVSD